MSMSETTMILDHQPSGQRRESVLRYERDGHASDAAANKRYAELVQHHLVATAAKLQPVIKLRDLLGQLAVAERTLAVRELDLANAERERPTTGGKSSGEAVAVAVVKHAKTKASLKETVTTMREAVSLLDAEAQVAEADAKATLGKHCSEAFQTAKAALHSEEDAIRKQLAAMLPLDREE